MLQDHMPQRYYFRLVSAEGSVEDPTGVMAANLNQAQVNALAAIAELRAAGELTERSGSWTLEIRDHQGTLLRCLRLD
ncbi:DUF6894 family protein [Methylobacterium durans]|uniref:DUF6894 family protein n=1 Tax=Methylobacterium durans TaxID=2202825 RepID=UPI003C6D611A